MERSVVVPYEDYQTLVNDAASKASVIKLLNTKFSDDTCQLIAIKALLEIEEPVEPEVTEPEEPSDSTNEEITP